MCAVTAIAWLAPSAGVRAHADLGSSSPADGAVVSTTTDRATLTFTEAVEPSAVGFAVTLPDGTQVTPEASSADGATWELAFPPVSAGSVAVAYDVISVDGHSIVGVVTFTVAAAPVTSPPPVSAPSPSPATTAPVVVAPAPAVAPADDDEGTSPVLWAVVLVGGAALLGIVGWTAARRKQP